MPQNSYSYMPNTDALPKDIEYDSTFKTISNLFQQLYTIYALVGEGENASIFPLGYVLMTNKLEEGYLHLFQELIELGEGSGYSLDPPIVLSDFELAAINAVQNKFPNTVNK
ncbi:19194_t:CDS:2, partial [Gigaspora margarita]